jgi:redox-sensitive bicupin YhaK (pirin superfamily)
MTVEILHRDDLLRGGFAGLKEHRLVMDPKAFGSHVNPGTWSGIGSFVYLADARFDPHGETKMHSHLEIDVISVMVEGRISHEGSLEHGQGLNALDVQVQRAGGEGFSHNEINPDSVTNRMIQLWVFPEKPGQPAGYKMYTPKWGEMAHIYGGSQDQEKTFDSQTMIDVCLLNPGQKVTYESEFMAYLTIGTGTGNSTEVEDGDLIRGTSLKFEAKEKCQLIVIHL